MCAFKIFYKLNAVLQVCYVSSFIEFRVDFPTRGQVKLICKASETSLYGEGTASLLRELFIGNTWKIIPLVKTKKRLLSWIQKQWLVSFIVDYLGLSVGEGHCICRFLAVPESCFLVDEGDAETEKSYEILAKRRYDYAIA